MDDFLSRLLWCENCGLSKTRTNVVVGDGDPKGDILFVGEAPGADEDEAGLPFVGRSGKLLREMIKEAGITDNLYITNTVKCRPPDNRDPDELEIKACLPWLNTQVKNMNPKGIIGVGRISASRIVPGFIIGVDHGKIYTLKDGIRFMGIYHPAYILRNRSIKDDVIKELVDFNDIINNL